MSIFENKITLTAMEIKDLAEACGFTINKESIDDEILEQELTITECPDSGIIDDDNSVIFHRHIVYYSEYPEEGCIPIGEPICGKCKNPWVEHDFGVPAPSCP